MATYATLDQLKAYGQVSTATDDAILLDLLERASRQIDAACGHSFDPETVQDEVTPLVWVTRTGWLIVASLAKAVVRSVASLAVLDQAAAMPAWQPLDLGSAQLIIPPALVPPTNQPWRVRCWVPPGTLPPGPIPRGRLLVRWTYDGGYASIPPALSQLTVRYAWWLYKLREAPLGRVVTAELGIMEIPLDAPLDLRRDLVLWQRVMPV